MATAIVSLAAAVAPRATTTVRAPTSHPASVRIAPAAASRPLAAFCRSGGGRGRRLRSVRAMAGATGEKKKLWGGRFSEDIDPLMEKFNESLSFDKRMAQEVRRDYLTH